MDTLFKGVTAVTMSNRTALLSKTPSWGQRRKDKRRERSPGNLPPSDRGAGKFSSPG